MKRTLYPLLLALALLLSACAKAEANTYDAQLDLGARYLSDGNYEEAILAFTAAIEIDPKGTDAYLGRANAYLLSGETESTLALALADYEAVLAYDETNAAAYLGAADVCIRRGDVDKAREILELGLEKTGGDTAIADKLEELQSGSVTDSAGKLRRRSSYDGEGSLLWYHTFTYNAQGQMTSVTSFDASDAQTGHVDRAFDDAGRRLVDYYYLSDGGAVGKIVFEYDANGHVSRETHYRLNGEASSVLLHTYDAQGNRVRTEYYNSDGEMTYYETMTYDAQGNEIRNDQFNPDGTCWGYTTMTYNEQGRRTEYCSYDSEGQLSWREVSLYDDNGSYIGYETYDGDGNLTHSVLDN